MQLVEIRTEDAVRDVVPGCLHRVAVGTEVMHEDRRPRVHISRPVRPRSAAMAKRRRCRDPHAQGQGGDPDTDTTPNAHLSHPVFLPSARRLACPDHTETPGKPQIACTPPTTASVTGAVRRLSGLRAGVAPRSARAARGARSGSGRRAAGPRAPRRGARPGARAAPCGSPPDPRAPHG